MAASTVAEYLAALPAERRVALDAVRRGINRALPPGYKEGIQFGKKLDMGQGCLRFKTLSDLALDVVEGTVARLPVSKYAAGYQAMRDAMGKGKAKAAARTRTPAKKAGGGANAR